ncbi:hypothetical protein KAR91_34735 [Candidatus Pacearchaeota archaeon]|nr:hypothetical protein [Candidatus Pacearchaeota archaeon]
MRKIEIDFPVDVVMHMKTQIALDKVIRQICYLNAPPGSVMWPGGTGSKITYMPMTLEDEKKRGIEFDDSIYHIDVSIRRRV